MADATSGDLVRPAEERDARVVARLVYSTAEAMFQRFGGDPERGLELVESAFLKAGTDSSREVIRVLERDGAVAGAIAGFDSRESRSRARRFLWLALSRTPPRQWPPIVRIHRLGPRVTVSPPPGSFYVDSIATAPKHRRSGVGSALLAHAEREARERGFEFVALDTSAANEPARGLYDHAGYEVWGTRPPVAPLPSASVSYVKRVR